MNLVLGRTAVITGNSTGGQNIETMTVGVGMIVLGRDYGIAASGRHIRSKSLA
jgi:hypothetical protein